MGKRIVKWKKSRRFGRYILHGAHAKRGSSERDAIQASGIGGGGEVSGEGENGWEKKGEEEKGIA